ncbi:MAG: hypothetical protein LQ342_005597 [Letrouitia transgressa]|nr:MAG: hypothetical protein LQ342_005597 [Letrouitia transgressa]
MNPRLLAPIFGRSFNRHLRKFQTLQSLFPNPTGPLNPHLPRLSFRSITTSYISTTDSGNNNSSNDDDNNIHRILTFWFNPTHSYTRWFTASLAFDAEITSLFSPLVATARSTSTLDPWSLSTPESALALILLLDQFPRNIHRNTPLAYATDAKALHIATAAIAQGFDRRVDTTESAFFYLPFQHAEDPVAKTASVALNECLAARAQQEGAGDQHQHQNQDAGTPRFVTLCLQAAISHRDVVARFGRFPARNRVLGRESTEEERRVLEEYPNGLF